MGLKGNSSVGVEFPLSKTVKDPPLELPPYCPMIPTATPKPKAVATSSQPTPTTEAASGEGSSQPPAKKTRKSKSGTSSKSKSQTQPQTPLEAFPIASIPPPMSAEMAEELRRRVQAEVERINAEFQRRAPVVPPSAAFPTILVDPTEPRAKRRKSSKVPRGAGVVGARKKTLGTKS